MPNKSSIALLAELKSSIDSCLDHAESVDECLDDDVWESGDFCDLRRYWDQIICNLEEMKRKIEGHKG